MDQDDRALSSPGGEPPSQDRKASGIGLVVVASLLLAAAGLYFWSNQKVASTQEYLARAQASRQQGKLNEAVIELKNALRGSPGNSKIRLELAQVYLKLAKGQEAEEQIMGARLHGATGRAMLLALAEALALQGKYNRVLKELELAAEFPGAAERLLATRLRADALFGVGRTSEACSLFLQARGLDPRCVQAYWGLARCAAASNDFASANEHLAKALEIEPGNLLTYLLQGQLARAMDHLPDAEAAYGRALGVDTGSIPALLARAEVRLEMGKADLALEDVKAAKGKSPDLVMVRYTEALIDYFQGRLTDALNRLLELTAKAPGHVPSRTLLGYVAFRLEQYHRADNDLTIALMSRPEDRVLRLALVQSRLKSGQPEGALQALLPLLKADKPDLDVLIAASDAYLQSGNLAMASEYLEKFAELAPQHPVLHAKLGAWRMQLGDLSGAVRELEAAAQQGLDPQQKEAWRITSRLMLKQYDQALALARSLAERSPKDATAPYLLGMAWLGKGDAVQARRAFEQVLALKPGDLPATRSLAQLDRQAGKPAAARARFEALLKHDPRHYEAMMELAMLAQAEKRDEDIAVWLARAAEAAKGETAPRFYLARHLLARGEADKALTWARQAHELNPRNPLAMELLGDAQYAAGDKTNAAYTYLQWSILDLRSAQAYYKLGRTRMEIGQPVSARESLERAVSLKPDHVEAALALSVLVLQDGRFAVAENLARQVQKYQPALWAGYAAEGDALVGLGRHGDAAGAFAQAFARKPSGDLAIRQHRALSRAGKEAAAQQVMAEWLRRAPQDLGARLYLGDSHLQAGRARAAAAEYQALLGLSPEHIDALVGLARALHAQGDAAALRYAEQAYKKGGSGAELADLLGWMTVEQGHLRRGLDLLQQAAMLRPEHTGIRYHLAAALARNGDPAQARRMLEGLLARGGEFPQRAEVQALLATLPAAKPAGR